MSILAVYVLLGIMALSIIGLFWLVLWVTRAPVMEYWCPVCGVCEIDIDGNCRTCGIGAELRDKGRYGRGA